MNPLPRSFTASQGGHGMMLELLDTASGADSVDIDRENRGISDLFRRKLQTDGPLPIDMLRVAQNAMAA